MRPGELAVELVDVVQAVDAAELEQIEATDWAGYNACPTCRVAAGEPCRALSGRVAGGRPDGVATPLERAHAARRRRVRR